MIESEKERRQERLKGHYNNNVWERREAPPEDWKKPLPDYLQKAQVTNHNYLHLLHKLTWFYNFFVLIETYVMSYNILFYFIFYFLFIYLFFFLIIRRDYVDRKILYFTEFIHCVETPGGEGRQGRFWVPVYNIMSNVYT